MKTKDKPLSCPSCGKAVMKFDNQMKISYCINCGYDIDLETPVNQGSWMEE